MAWIYIYIFFIWTLAWRVPVIQGVKSGLGVGIAIDQGEPDTVIAQKTSDLLLNCSVTLNPDLEGTLETSWLKDGVPVDLNKRIQLYQNGSLYLRRVIHRPRKNRTDEGHYRCLATIVGIGQVIARDVRVQVAGIERKFDVEPEPQEVVVGGVARFQCSIRAVPPPIYIWEFNKNSLPQSENRYFLLSSGILHITGVQESDAGLYRCYAAQGSVHILPGKVSDIDGKYSREGSLTVKTAGQPLEVKILSSSGNVTSRLGSQATLECLVQGLNRPAEWRKDGTKVTSSIDGRIKQIGNNLHFMDLEIGDTGKYQCVADRFAVETVSLTVIKRPVIVNGPETVEKVSSQWQYLNCDAEGHPKPNITWFKDGRRLDLDDSASNYRRGPYAHQLAIVQSEPFNSGYYQCFATNEAGTTSAIARLDITVQDNTPGSPNNIRVLNVTSTSMKLKWDSPNKEPVLAYSVHYRKPGNRPEDRVTQSSNVELTGLDPYCNYTITIKAYTKQGAGPKSRPFPVQTMESVPIQPVMITLMPRTSSINVTWTEMAARYRQGVIVAYKLYYRPKDKPEVEKEITNIPASARFYLLKDLLPQTTYEVRVKAGTSVGFPLFNGVQWPWVHVQTEPVNYGDIDPPSIRILPINATAVNATWSLQGDKDIKQFILKLEVLPSQETFKPVNLSSQQRFYVLYRLDEKVRYELTLVVKSSDDSEAMVTKEFQTLDLPMIPRPTDLRVTLSEGTSLQVTWLQPPTEFEIEYFTVRYMLENGIEGTFSVYKSYTNSALLKDLLENTVYNISVSAHSLNMRSVFSDTILGQTGGIIPCDPDATLCPTSTELPMEGKSQGTNEQRLGIVIGVSIGLFCIVICILIIVLRNRCLTPTYNQQPMTQPARFHGNGHIPGNGNGHAVSLHENRRSVGMYEMDAYTPMLDNLPENEESDSKGGGGGNVILTPNGAKLNGFVPLKKNGVRNGQNHNGHLITFLPNQFNGETVDAEETRGLIAAMLSGGNGQCLTGRMGEDSFTTSRVDDLGSLDGIDHSSCEDMLRASQVRTCAQDDEHNDSSCSATSDRHSETVFDSLPRPVRNVSTDNTESGLRRTHLNFQHQSDEDGDVSDMSDLCNNIPHSVRHDTNDPPSTSGTTGDSVCQIVVGDKGSRDRQIPHNQLSTSIKSQASESLDSDPALRGSSSTPPPLLDVTTVAGVIANGIGTRENPIVQDRDRNLDNDMPPEGHHGNGVCNGGLSHPPQGLSRLVLTENNPSIPQSPQPRETILSHGSREISLDTLAQTPQDAAPLAMVTSSPRKYHYQV